MALVPVLAAVAAGLVYAAVAAVFNAVVPDPYMDEVFHVPQTRAFCQGRFDAWDPKVTAPPGPYLAVAAISLAADQLGAQGAVCTTAGLRYASAALGGLAVGLSSLSAARLFSYMSGGGQLGWESRRVTAAAIWGGLLLAVWPLHAFFASLWYTDSVANAALLLALVLSLPRVGTRAGLPGWQITASALAGASAIACRQTNAVWIAPVAVGAVLRRLHMDRNANRLSVSPRHSKTAQGGDADHLKTPRREGRADGSGLRQRSVALPSGFGLPGGRGAPVSLQDEESEVIPACNAGQSDAAAGLSVTGLPSAAHAVLATLRTLWREVAAYGAVLAGFAVFALGSGKLVVGERSNQVPTLHAAQAGYALTAAAAVMALPLFAQWPLASARLAWEWLTGRCLGCSARRVGQRLDELGALFSAEERDREDSEAAPMRGARVCSWGSQALLLIGLCGAGAFAAGTWTVEHPFLLADDRHIVLHVWKQVLQNRVWLRFAMGPLYIAAAGAVAALVLASRAGGSTAGSAALADALVLATLFTTGLTPLLDPRCWTPLVALLAPVAAAAWGAHPGQGAGVVVATTMAGVAALVAFLFVARPYTWADGSTARTMW